MVLLLLSVGWLVRWLAGVVVIIMVGGMVSSLVVVWLF